MHTIPAVLLIQHQLTAQRFKVEKAAAAVIDATIIHTADGKQRQTETFAKPSDVDAVQGVAAQRAQTYHTEG